MYKLENDVAWTEDLKNAFKHNMTRASILYDNNEINEDNNLVDLALTEERYISNYGFIGSAVARKLTLTLQNSNNPINIEDKDLTLKIGAVYNNSTYYINYGNFLVYEPPETDETSGKVTAVAYDYMIKFDKPYVDEVNYPVTLGVLLSNICQQAGVTLGTTDFPNKNFSVTDNQFEGNTLREVLMNIAKCAFSWARIGQDNKLYLDFETKSTLTPVETVTIDEYKLDGFKKASEYYGPVNRVIYADSNIEGQEEKVDDTASIQQYGLKELVIYDNLFAYTPEKRQALIQAGTSLFGLKYMPVSQLDLVGFIYLEANDLIKVQTLDEQEYITRPFNHTINYNGAVNDTVSAEGTSDTQDTYKNTANDVMQNQRTRIIVDKAQKQIDLLSSEIDDQGERIADLTIDVDQIELKVDNMYNPVRTVTGNRQIVLEKCIKGYLIKLRIIGNNNVFKRLYPADDLYPSDTLYPMGDSRITMTDKDGVVTNYELGVTEVLRANDEVYDEYILEDNYAKVIRRVNADGTTKAEEVIENIGIYTIYVNDDTNTIRIKNYAADMEVSFVEQNAYTNQFVTDIEMTSAITQTAEEINTEVRRKVGEDEIISKINQSAEQIQIEAEKININGTISANGNFKVDTNGNMECTGAKLNNMQINGGTLNFVTQSSYTPINFYNNNQATGGIAGDHIEMGYFDGSYCININTLGESGEISVSKSPNSSITPSISVADTNSNSTIRSDYIRTPVLYQTSQASSKKNFEPMKDALGILKDIEIYKYNMKHEDDKDKKHIGFVIGDNFKHSKEITSKDDDNVDIYSFVSLCCQGIKEQQEQIEQMQKEIKELKGEK